MKRYGQGQAGGILLPNLRKALNVMRNTSYPQNFRNFGKISYMSKEDLKAEIYKVLDNLSDRTLEEILTQLKRIDPSESKEVLSDSFIEKIMSEDSDLLKRLAS